MSTPSWSSPRPATSKLSLSAAIGDADRDIALGLALEAVADDAALHLVAVAAGIGAVVDRRSSSPGSAGRSAARGAARCTDGSAMVLETVALIRPAMATMSPASALSTGTRSRPRKAKTLVARPSSTTLPSTSSALIGMLIVEPAALDPAGEDAAEERVAVEQGGEHPERAGVDARRAGRG